MVMVSKSEVQAMTDQDGLRTGSRFKVALEELDPWSAQWIDLL